MLIEELQANPRGEDGGETFNGAEGGDGGDSGGEFGGDDGDLIVSQEPPTSIIVTNLTLDIFEQPPERVSSEWFRFYHCFSCR